MSESIQVPQISYSLGGELSIRAGLDEGRVFGDDPERRKAQRESRAQVLEDLSSQGATVEKVDDYRYSLRVDVQEHLGEALYLYGQGDEMIASFLNKIRILLPFLPEDNIDRVVSLKAHHSTSGGAEVNHQFQRWMNAHGLNEENGKETIMAMELPLEEGYRQLIERDFQFVEDQNTKSACAEGSLVAIRHEWFGVTQTQETEGEPSITRGKVVWGWPELRTLGGACIGANGRDREGVRMSPHSKRLYELTSNNVDMARQSLSMLLGLGTMARHAAAYEGSEDILEQVEWQD